MKGDCKVREVKKGWMARDGVEKAEVLAGFMRDWRDWEWKRWGGFDGVRERAKCVRGTSKVGSYSLLGG